MRFSEARGRKVVSTSTADSVGTVHDFVVDPKAAAVLAMEVKKAEAGNTLRWSDITAFGSDAVTVTGPDKITEAGDDVAALLGKDHRVVGKRVLSTDGDELGEVADVEFDVDSGAITSLVLDEGGIAGARLVGVGPYAVVVRAE
jgi:uncharacterized protein YrrD